MMCIMNKKGQIDWGLVGVTLILLFIFIASVYSIYTSNNNALEKHTELCERKKMTYFDFKYTDASSVRVVICLDEYGEQHEVILK